MTRVGGVCGSVLFTLIVGVGAVASAPAGAAPEAGTGTVTVTPDTGLVDEQVVTVHGEGVEPHPILSVAQCLATGTGGCRENYGVDFDAAQSGTFTLHLRLEAAFTLQSGDDVDCRDAPGTCELSIALFSGKEGSPEFHEYDVPLTFDSSAPLAPAPTLAVSPSSGLRDGYSVDITGDGFDPSGSADGDAIGFVDFLECTTPTYVSGRCALANMDNGYGRTDATGAIAQRVRLKAVILRLHDRTDCRTTTCYLLAREAPDGDQVSVALAFDPDAPLYDSRIHLTVFPSTGLSDGQRVTVDATGFFPEEQPRIYECGRRLPACTEGLEVTAGPDGSVHLSFVVHRRFHDPSYDMDVDCGASTCSIATGRAAFIDYEIREPISFAGASRPPSTPTTPVAVEPTFTG